MNGNQVKYIVVEYIDGQNLLNFLRKGPPLPTPLAKQTFITLFKIICSAHNHGIVHRDIKLENFMVKRDGTLVVIDFGFAAPVQGFDNYGYLDDGRIGTHGYMAPEILQRKPYHGCPADIFAMGVILFELIFRFHPFKAASSYDKNYGLIAKNSPELFW